MVSPTARCRLQLHLHHRNTIDWSFYGRHCSSLRRLARLYDLAWSLGLDYQSEHIARRVRRRNRWCFASSLLHHRDYCSICVLLHPRCVFRPYRVLADNQASCSLVSRTFRTSAGQHRRARLSINCSVSAWASVWASLPSIGTRLPGLARHSPIRGGLK